jgi:RimJ/RimL family protein N-acetyltransferase
MIARLIDTPVLDTERLILRAPELRDFDAYARFFASPRAARVGGPTARDKCWRYFGHHVGHWALRGYGSFFIEDRATTHTLGLILAWCPEGYPEREIGWILFDGADEGKGYIDEAARRVLTHIWTDFGWDTVVSYIDPANDASRRVAARLGAARDMDAPRWDDPADDSEVWRHRRAP